MVFNSWAFLAFFVVVWAAHARCSGRAQNAVLLAASYFFYGWWDWRFLGLLALSTIVDFVVAQRLESAEGRRRRVLVGVSIGTNLGVLGFFKYFDFFVGSAGELLTQLGFSVELPTLALILPVGISFYTFQSMGYSIDVYRRRVSACRDPILFALYVAYFPQLVAGPIERAERLLPQLRLTRRPQLEALASGALLVLIGLVRKVLIADVLADEVETIFASSDQLGSTTLLCGALCFALQIYGDFAGYSDMARGISRMLGVELMVNFHHPYLARTITSFWRRWHVSLSTWLRDYLYIPLGGNRLGAGRTYVNLLATMVLGGLWHGASWTFVVWGAIHGLALAGHKLWLRGEKPVLEPLGSEIRSHGPMRLVGALASWLLTMAVVLIAWVFFRAQDLSAALAYVGGVFSLRGTFELSAWPLLVWMVAVTLFLDLPQVFARDHTPMLRWRWPVRGLAYSMLLILLVLMAPEREQAFIYFQF